MNTGILIAGGLCPGVHNLVHDLTLYEKSQGNHVFGFRRGFGGLNLMTVLRCQHFHVKQ